jgi:preprotein translocase subunit SecG
MKINNLFLQIACIWFCILMVLCGILMQYKNKDENKDDKEAEYLSSLYKRNFLQNNIIFMVRSQIIK